MRLWSCEKWTEKRCKCTQPCQILSPGDCKKINGCPKNKTGKWIPAQGFMQISDDDIPDVPYHDRFTQRQYCLFGFLAGVRYPDNQHFKTKGFPENASKEVRAQYDKWGIDAHTPSYLTKEDLDTVH